MIWKKILFCIYVIILNICFYLAIPKNYQATPTLMPTEEIKNMYEVRVITKYQNGNAQADNLTFTNYIDFSNYYCNTINTVLKTSDEIEVHKVRSERKIIAAERIVTKTNNIIKEFYIFIY